MSTPVVPDCCWPIDEGCCSNWDDYPPEVQVRSIALATMTLRALTGYRVGGCPVTVRPCRRSCVQPYLLSGHTGSSGLSAAGAMRPLNVGGTWINSGCGCGIDNCSCTVVCELVLPPPVGFVESVQLGTQELPPDWYRLDNGNRLVWQGPDDLDCWPLCQDMTAPVGAPDTFAVRYLNAQPVDALAAYVAGVLACEFAKACSGQKCRLPSGVTAVARQGVSFTVVRAMEGGRTGIVEVDAWLRVVNPYALVTSSQVYSPDLPAPRTWVQPPIVGP